MNKLDVEIMRSVGAEIYGNWEELRFNSVQMNHKMCTPNSIFIGMTGQYTAGYRFAKEAIQNGAVGLILSEKVEDINVPYMVFENIPKLLELYAEKILAKFQKPVIAILGSAGKTSLRHMLKHILPNSLSTKLSRNLMLSITMTCLELNNNYDYFIVECGTSFPGEINYLGRFLQPDYVIYTDIGLEHLDNLIDLDTIIKEESAMLPYVKKGAILSSLIPNPKNHLIIYTDQDWTVNNTAYMNTTRHSTFRILDETIRLEHHLYPQGTIKNLGRALLLCKLLGVQPVNIHTLTVPCLRGNVIYTPTHEIHDHSYNASPFSVHQTVDSMETPGDFILGEMGELGPDSQNLHEETILYMCQNPFIQNLYFLGKNLIINENLHPKLTILMDTHVPKLNSTVYIQGSKSMHMIKYVLAIIANENNLQTLEMFKHL